MKKFMIFLLMAFLYIGTCQARSESAHPNDAQLKLLSWVSPTPDQSFMTRSVADAPGDLVLLTASPAGPVALGEEVSLTLSPNSSVPAEILSALALLGYPTLDDALDAATITWEVNGSTSSPLVVPNADKFKGTFSTMNVGTYSVKAILAIPGTTFTSESNTYTIVAENGVIFANIVGNNNVCEDDNVTLTAMVSGDATAVTNYVWLYKENPVATGPVFTFQPSVLFGTNTDHKIKLEVAYGSCSRAVDSIIINYLPAAPDIHVNIVGGPVCVGGQVTATIQAAGTTLNLDNPIYSWYVNGVEVPGEHMGVITLNMPMAGAYGFAAMINTPMCGVSVQSEPDTVYVYDALPLTITGNNVICQNDTAVLTATDIANASYSWAGPDLSNKNRNVLKTTIPGVYAVTATLEGGCSAVAEFTVYQFGGDLQVYASEMTVCPGTPVMLNANLDGWLNENISYQWSDGLGTSSTVSTTVDETHTYYVTATAQPQATTTGGPTEDHSNVCQLTSSITINVSANDTVRTNVLVMNEPQCVGDQVILKAQPKIKTASGWENATTSYNYIWYKDGVEIPGENQGTVLTTLNHAGNYTFVAKAVVGDCNTSLAGSGQVVSVMSAPTVYITGTQEVVNNATTAVLTASVQPEPNETTGISHDGGITYDYDFTWSTGETGRTITVTNEGLYNVTVTNANGCSAVSAPYQVNDVAPVTITLNGGPTEVCITEDILVEASVTPPTSTQQIRWLANGQYIEGQTGPTFTMSAQDLYDIIKVTEFDLCVEITDVATCAVASKCVHKNITGLVIPDHIVILNDGSPAQNICEGAQLDLTVYVKDKDGEVYEDTTLNYVWTRNGVVIPGVHGSHFSEQAWIYDGDPVNYVYAAYIDFGNGCVSEQLDATEVYVHRNPIVTIDGNPNVCYNGLTEEPNVKLTAWVDGYADLTATYAWYESGQYRDVPTSDYIYEERHDPTYDNPLIFTVEVTNGNGCSSISDPFYVNVYDKPVVNITGNDTMLICRNGSVELRASLNNYHDPMLVFQWYENVIDENTLLPGYTHEIETFYPTETTTYLVQVTHLMDYSDPGNCVGQSQKVVKVADSSLDVDVENDLNGENVICEGRSITFNATLSGGFPDTVALNTDTIFTWYRNGELIENVTGDLYVDAPLTVDGVPTTYIYAVQVHQGLSGCESPLVYFDTITVNPNPNIQLATDPIVCADSGYNIILVANMDAVPTDVHYRWLEDNAELLHMSLDPDINRSFVYDTIFTAGGDTVVHYDTIYLHRPYSENPYNFSVQIVNDYGCTGQSDAIVYVNAAPKVHITTTDNVVCEGGVITLNAALNDWNSDALTYQWYEDDTPIADGTTLSYTFAPALGNHQYNIVINQTTSGCVAEADSVINVNVVARPEITSITKVNMSVDTVCDGYQVNLTAAFNVDSIVDSNNAVFTWYRNGVVIEGATQATLSEVVSAMNGETTEYAYAVSVALTTPGCESDIYNDTNSIVVNPNPTLQLVTDPIVCNDTGENVTLIAHLNPAMENATYKWLEDNAEMDPATYTANGDTIKLHRDYRDYPYSFAVELENNYGCTAVGEALVYVNDRPIVNITATDTILCVGGATTLTATLNNWNANELTFQWYDDTVAISGATELSYTVTPALVNDSTTKHNYHVEILQLTSLCEATSNHVNVYVNPIPEIVSVVPSKTNICYGGQVAITATPADSVNVEGEYYTWYRNGILMEGATAATIFDTPEIVDNNTQQYIYTAVLTRPQPGCSSLPKTSAAVTVYANPVVVITGDQHVCETDSVFLIANVDTNGLAAGGLHYTWYESGQIRDNMAYNLGDNNFYAEYMYARTEPYRFTVDVWRDNAGTGCVSHSEEYLVYVYPQPVVNITATETEICENGQVTLTANLNDNNATDLIYQWYTVGQEIHQIAIGYDTINDGEFIYASDTVSVRYNIPGATAATYTTNLTETTTLGVMILQTTSTCWTNDEVTITVNPIPEVTGIIVSNDTVCDGTQVTVSATIDTHGTPADGATYTWYRNGDLIEGVTGASFSENVFTTDDHITVNSYTAVVTLPVSGCVSLVSAPNTVTILPAPTTVSISGVNVICENDSTTLIVYSNVPGNITWSTGSHKDTITVPAGTYTVTVETLGCQMTSEPFTVEAFGTDLLVSASATAICRGEHTTLYVDQDGWQGNVTYQWDAQADSSTATTVDVQPDSTTTYHVVATVNSTNGSCSFPGEVTIIVHQLPAVFNVTASADTICEGQQITFTAPVDPQVTGYIWYQNGVEIPGENQNAITVNFNEAGNYTFAAKAISVDGCVSAEASTPVAVTVNPAPSQVTISGINVLCENTTTTLTAYSDVEGTFTWSNGIVGATNVVPAGVYHVTLTTPQGCELTSDNFTVEAFGTDLLVSASATAICQGEHTTLYVDQEGWQGNVTYQWDANVDSNYATATTVDVQPESTTTYHVTATVSSTNGTCTAEGEVTIIVTPRPAQVVVTATEDTICEGHQITFNASGNAYSYIWYQNGVEIPGENQATLTVNFNEAGNYAFAAKAVNDQNCESAEASEPVTVTVNPAPSQVTISGINVLCENTTTTLTAYSDVEGTFTWSNGIVGATNVVPAGVYHVTLTTPQGCELTSDNFTVEAFGTDLLVSASATAICQGEHTTLYVDQEGWQGNVTYQWDAPVDSIYATATTVDVQPDQTTTYHVTATVSSTNGTCTAEGEVTIFVTPRPAQVVVTATEDTICEGHQITFNASGNAYSYIWYQNGVEIPGENQPTLTVNFNEAGNYTFAAKAVNDQNCESAEASVPVTVTVNPAPSQVTISGINVLCENTTTTLTAYSDVEGTFTWSNGIVGATNVVPAGVYHVTLTTPQGCELTSDNFTVEAFGTDLLVSASATAICQGEHTTLYVDQEGWQGNVTYQWDANVDSNYVTATTVDVQPESTTTYHVTATVSSTNGTCTAEGEVTIIVNPLPVVAAVTSTDTVVCEGTQVTFTATGDANTTAYIWYNNGVEIPGENQAVLTVNFNEAGVYNYAVKAISNEGCVAATAFNAPTVTVNAAPESVTISGNTLICDGGSTTLYANVVPNMPATYEWYMNNVPMDALGNSIIVNEAGSYKVVASFNGCSTESDAVVVTVEETPNLQLTATESIICAGGSTVITAEATGWNNGDVIYNWSNGFQGSSFTFTTDSAANYQFIVTASQSTSGCSASDTINITVNAVPAAPQIAINDLNNTTSTICDGGQVKLYVTNAVAGAVYTWYRNGVIISGATHDTIYDSPVAVDGDATDYVYTAIATLPMSGCVSEASANAIVHVIPTPVVMVSVEGNTTLCVGGSTTLHANVTPANANYTYQWYKDNVLIPGATTADYTATEIARETAYIYSVVVSADAGCNVTAYAPAITFVADPVVDITISNNISCVGGAATLTAVVDGGVAGVNGLNGYTYEWYNNIDPTTPVSNMPSFMTSDTLSAGIYSYWVTVTSNYGCQTTSVPVAYSVIADPDVTIAVAAGYPTTVCNGGASMLTANVTGGYGDVTYQWYKNGNLLVGEINQTLSLANLPVGADDNYTVVVSQTGVGCGNSASVALNTLVTVVPTYTVDISGFGNVCEGGTLTLTATVNNVLTGDVLSYQWYRITNGDDAVAISGANAAQYSTSDLLLGNSYDYYVVVTSNISGCSVVSNSVPANVVPAPTVTIQGANTVCQSGDLTLNAFVTGGVEGVAYTYVWNWYGAGQGSDTTAVSTYHVTNLQTNDAASPYYFTVTISRNDNTGCTAISDAHEVNVLAVPTVTVTADNQYVCENGDVTFTANVSPVGSYNYVWTINGAVQSVNANTVSTAIANVGTITASVTVSAANASASCSASATIATPVQVVAAPTVTISADHLTMCAGGTTTLTSNITVNNNIPAEFNYQWAINGIEVPGAVANTFVQSLDAAGEYVYTLRVSQNNNLGCSSAWSAPVTVQVAEQPVVVLNSQDGLSICEGGSITMTGVVTNYNNTINGVTNSAVYGAMTYSWTSNGTPLSFNQAQITTTLNTVGNYGYQITVDPAGYNCQPQASNILVVNVVGDPSWTEVHVYGSNGAHACLGDMVTLEAEIQGGVADYSGSTSGHIQWVVTNGTDTIDVSGGLGGSSYDIPAVAGTYTYIPTFVGNIGNGCQLTNTAAVQTDITIHDLPTAVFTSGDSSSICSNDPSASAALVISFTGVAPFTYEVVDGHGNVVAHATTQANTATIYVAPTEQTTYRLTLIQDAYCENTSFGVDAVATVFVNSIEFANTVFESGCDNPGWVTVDFTMTAGNPNAAFTVVYESVDMIYSGTISNNTATFTAPTEPGDYNAVITIDGCSYDIVVRVLVGEFSFGDGSYPIMDQRWNDVVVVNNNPVYNGGHVFVGFQWYKNGVAIPGATYSNYQEKGGLNGFYSVELIEQDANGNMVYYKTCEMYFNSVSSVKVYPVPANVRQEITIELDLTSEELEGAVLDIYSVTGSHVGHVIDLQPITKIEGFKAQGTYFGRILTGTNEIKTVKFVIVK